MADGNAWMKLFDILDEADPDVDVYVYRLDGNGQRRKPYLLRTYPFPGLVEMLRDEYGSGEYGILIRSGHTMILSGEFGVEAPHAVA